MLVKLCGFTDELSVKAAIASKCDFLGFIFFDKSPRNISPKNAAIISHNIPNSISKVAVVVNPSFEFLQQIAEEFSPDFFQFHGDEDIDFLRDVRKRYSNIKIIKAFRIKEEFDLNVVNNFVSVSDFFLFDSKIEDQFGGSGKKFDWKILKEFQSARNWFLSGGLNINNIEEAIKITDAKMIDVSSGIEESRGKKSVELIKNFMNKVREINVK